MNRTGLKRKKERRRNISSKRMLSRRRKQRRRATYHWLGGSRTDGGIRASQMRSLET